jgi:ribosomal protein S21
MVNDKQVRRLMKLRKTEKTLAGAAAKAGMDEKTARKWLRLGRLPSQCQAERNWCTRTDPFEAYWEEIEKILKRAPSVLVTTLFDYLCRQYPGEFQEGQLRTLQRRVKSWRACHGDPQEVFFAQRHRPGDQAQSDFTHMGALGVTIAGEPFEHLVYHFVLTYSNWETATICFSESFESLSAGLQNALWELGGVPREHRTDSLSSAVHQLKHPEEFTDRYQELLSHYGLKASHSQAGKAHENGDIEQAHFRFKQAIEQELILRGHRDFTDREAYESFLREVLKRRNAARAERLGEEIQRMRRLPDRRLEDCTRQRVRVSRESTIRVRHNTYSVDSRLMKEWVEVRIFADRLAIWYGQRQLDEMPRLRGSGKHRIQYRHVIHSLVKKPGVFERYRYREDLFPSLLFRVAYDELREDCPGTAVRQYLRILLWAAEISEERVERCLKELIEQGRRIRADEVWERLKQDQPRPEKWQVSIQPVEVGEYDQLLECIREVAS